MSYRSYSSFLLACALVIGAVLPPMPAAAATEHLVPFGTPVDVALEAPLSSRGVTMGRQVYIRVINDVVVDGAIVIARGARGVAEVLTGAPARIGAVDGQVSLRTLWVRAVDHSRIGIEGEVSENGQPRDIMFLAYALSGASYFAGGRWSCGCRPNPLRQAAAITGAVASVQKGGEAVLHADRPIHAEVANYFGVRIASDISAGYEDDTPIK